MKAYILNLSNIGLTELTEFNYNSVADFNGETILLSDTGIYKLDKTEAVPFSFSSGYIFTDKPASTYDAYINRTPISPLTFKVTSLEGVTITYTALTNATKINLGKGHRSTMFKYTISGNAVVTNITAIKINLLPSKRNV